MITLRLELFCRDVVQSADFYNRVLGFERVLVREDGYTVLKQSWVEIHLQSLASLPDDHPVRPRDDERIGMGVEIVLEVDDVRAAADRALGQGASLAAPLQTQPWGLTDFRLFDPDGRYLRVTARPR